MKYQVIDTGNSRSFPAPHALLANASGEGDAVLIFGVRAGEALRKLPAPAR